jgi:hypothetical protein
MGNVDKRPLRMQGSSQGQARVRVGQGSRVEAQAFLVLPLHVAQLVQHSLGCLERPHVVPRLNYIWVVYGTNLVNKKTMYVCVCVCVCVCVKK